MSPFQTQDLITLDSVIVLCTSNINSIPAAGKKNNGWLINPNLTKMCFRSAIVYCKKRYYLGIQCQ